MKRGNGGLVTAAVVVAAPFLVFWSQALFDDLSLISRAFEELKNWQTLLAAFFVIGTIRATYNIDRQRRRERDRQNRSLVASIATEVSMCSQQLTDILLELRYEKQRYKALRRLASLPSPVIYSRENTELFNMDADYIKNTVEFYYTLDQLTDELPPAYPWQASVSVLDEDEISQLQGRLIDILLIAQKNRAAAVAFDPELEDLQDFDIDQLADFVGVNFASRP
ncbi:hypothetical protein [Rhodophyticola porphyridii]|uniref:hypothetical protein n=1 Tax=Rhodophyticola porphyridii TaxID=1852017 RepID=UPI0035CF9306